jgi:hypothetical protein
MVTTTIDLMSSSAALREMKIGDFRNINGNGMRKIGKCGYLASSDHDTKRGAQQMTYESQSDKIQ